MLSKNDIKYIRSLNQGKYREKYGCFVAEGFKVINELIESGMICDSIYTIDETLFERKLEVIRISAKELKQISFLNHPKDALAVFRIPEEKKIDLNLINQDYTLVCDRVQDPGNFGTIIRIADWFGIRQIICSPDSVDVYNPKVVQSSMASLGRVSIVYTELLPWLKKLDEKIPLMVSSLKGDDLFSSTLPLNGILVLGNESKGISEEISQLAQYKILIPGFGKAESLNVAVSAGILCAEFRRPKN